MDHCTLPRGKSSVNLVSRGECLIRGLGGRFCMCVCACVRYASEGVDVGVCKCLSQ